MNRDAPQLEPWLRAMRDPLSRVELAASQLMRIEATPLVHALATSIRTAVFDLDARIQEAIGASRSSQRRDVGETDCRGVVGTVVSRLERVLGARSCALEAARIPAQPVLGDAMLARRAALRLLRGSAAWVGAGGRVRLAIVDEAGRYGVRVEAERVQDGARAAGDAFAMARRFALAEGADFTFEPGEGHENAVATLWLPRGDA